MSPSTPSPLQGVWAAMVTPLTPTLQPDVEALPALLTHLAARGCHGALMFGTTGEGPSFSHAERVAFLRAALAYRNQALPDFKIMAGTGCTNLPDTIALTRAAFDEGVEGVVTLPAFYFKNVSPTGLAAYYAALLQQAVPSDGRLFIYHFPQLAGVGVPDETVAQLRAAFPHQLAGMKDSQDDLAHTLATARAFPGFGVFAGSDSIFTDALAGGAAGCITALANVTAPLNRAVWDAHQRGEIAVEAQIKLTRAREIVKGLPGPAVLKAALADLFGFPLWGVRPPLEWLSIEQRARVCEGLRAVLG